MPELLSTRPTEARDLPLFPLSGTPLVSGDSTNSPTFDVPRQTTVLRQVDDLLEALARRWSDEAYLARVAEWAGELRKEMERDPKRLRGRVDDVYDAAYAELLDLERRIL